MSHTPASWIYDQKRTRVVAEDRELLVADIRGWGNLQKRSDGAEIMDANGYLIAAAPELLAALERLVEAIEFTPLSIRALRNLAVAREAIAKARGESCNTF